MSGGTSSAVHVSSSNDLYRGRKQMMYLKPTLCVASGYFGEHRNLCVFPHYDVIRTQPFSMYTLAWGKQKEEESREVDIALDPEPLALLDSDIHIPRSF